MGRDLIRNIFDQYQQPENRLTHALIHVLAHNPRLTREFVRFATGSTPPKGTSFSFSCQLLPGEETQRSNEEDYAERHGLPDAWIYDEHTRWAVVFECKVRASLRTDQLVRYVLTARKRGFDDAHLLVITANESKPAAVTHLRSKVAASWVSWPQKPSSHFSQCSVGEQFTSKNTLDTRIIEGYKCVIKGV